MAIEVCVDQFLPEELRQDAARRTMEENTANAIVSPVEPPPAADGSVGFGAAAMPALDNFQDQPMLAIVTPKMWQVGRTLRCRFLGGDTKIQEKVIHYAQEWLKYADLGLSFGTDPQSEIRISFVEDGSWSNIGTDSLSVPANQATMNFGWLTRDTADNEYSRVVIHEFGHALGCIHEHQNPAGDIQWNKEAVYRYYMGPPNNWTKAQVDNNLFAKYSSNITQFSQLDGKSIMMYPIPKEFTTNGFSVGMNRELSPMDKTYIARWYPPYVARINMTSQQYQQTFNDLTGKGFRLASISGYNFQGDDRYAAVFMKTPVPGMTAWVARHGMSSQQYQQAFDGYVGQGYRLADVSGYQVGSDARYAALWVKAPGPAFVARHGLTSQQYQQAFNQYVSQGFRLTHVSGYGVNNQAYYAAIWEKNNGTPFVARHGMSSQQYQQAFNQYTSQGYRLTDVSGYAVGNQTLYAAIWAKVGGPGYVARHGLSSGDYLQDNQQYLNQGFAPVRVDGYTSGNQDRYAGIWQALL
jgi:hypothetical protein